MNSRRILLKLAALAAIGVIAYLALRASPWVGEVPWIPRWLSDWADRNGNLRNLPAFAALAAVLMFALGRHPGAALAAVLSAALELAQVFISGRTFDWADIGWSLAGVALVAGATEVFSRSKSAKAPRPR
jgi:hypothetical protein